MFYNYCYNNWINIIFDKLILTRTSTVVSLFLHTKYKNKLFLYKRSNFKFWQGFQNYFNIKNAYYVNIWIIMPTAWIFYKYKISLKLL